MSKRISFSSQKNTINPPDLLGLQLESFKALFEIDSLALNKKEAELYKIFQKNFPISDAKENFTIEFLDYNIESPVYTPEECLQKELTYSVALKIKLRLLCKEESSKNITQTLFLGQLPYMTPQGSFIINGKERVIVSQIHRSYGVFFSESMHISGVKLYSAKIIPLKGAWIEFVTDVNKVMYAYIDRRKKFPITLILRALGYGTDKELLKLFDLGKEIKTTRKNLEAHKGSKLAGRLVKDYFEEFVDPETGEIISMTRNEILLERDTILDEGTIQIILDSDEPTVMLRQEQERSGKATLIYNTLKKDEVNSEKEAIEELYRRLRGAEPPDETIAREFANQLFFSPQRTYLGKVGRYNINKKLGLNINPDVHNLTAEDIIKTIKHFFLPIDEKIVIVDGDSLSNRRVRSPGEQVSDVLNVAIARIARIIRERMSVRISEEFKPIDLVSTKILPSLINTFFCSDPLVQFKDQVNLLSEVSHARRISALGKRGLTRERAGFSVREPHHLQLGRVCQFETPDNRSISLILALAIYAKLDEMGFIQAPYKKVTNGKLDTSQAIHYLAASEEEGHIIAGAAEVDKDGNFIKKKLKVRQRSNFFAEAPENISYTYVGNQQIVGASAGMIPFLEKDDASRALMGSNMLRQAIPLNHPQAAIVCTGLGKQIVQDSRILPKAQEEGIVSYVDADKIIITSAPPKGLEILPPQTQTYLIKRLVATNQNTCINLRPLVKKGQHIKKGQILCEGYGTQNGELALGRNLKTVFMSYKGFNYEDAIVVSEDVAKMYTSLHIYEFIIEAVDTKLGPEKFTADIPNMREEQLQNLDENGIIAVGTKVKPGDILVGKVTPKAQKDLMPENVLLQAIFGEKACNVKDTSLRTAPSVEGTVIDTQLFKRHERNKQQREEIAKKLLLLKKLTNKKLFELKKDTLNLLTQLLSDKKTIGIYTKEKETIIKPKQLITEALLDNKILSTKEGKLGLQTCSIKHINLTNWFSDKHTSQITETILKKHLTEHSNLISDYKKEKYAIEIGDNLPLDVLQRVKVRIATERPLQVGDKMAGRHGNKGIVAKVEKRENMPFLSDGTHVDIILSPLGITSRMIVGPLLETILGLAGKKLNKNYAIEVFGSPSMNKIEEELQKAGIADFGLTTLYDGATGEPFKQKVTYGITYMLKLNHLVDGKMNVRSTGPYAMITQQPLGGRAKRGGQRLGEMESAAIQAYGAAYTLMETSIKSDDTEGRKRAIEAMVKDKNLPLPGIPESFKILQHELKGLGIQLKLIYKDKAKLKI